MNGSERSGAFTPFCRLLFAGFRAAIHKRTRTIRIRVEGGGHQLDTYLVLPEATHPAHTDFDLAQGDEDRRLKLSHQELSANASRDCRVKIDIEPLHGTQLIKSMLQHMAAALSHHPGIWTVLVGVRGDQGFAFQPCPGLCDALRYAVLAVDSALILSLLFEVVPEIPTAVKVG